MTTFKFPPPPPPPPKPVTHNTQPPPTNHRGGHNGGCNDFNRAKGVGNNCAPSFHSSNGGTRGGHGHSNSRGNGRGRGGYHGGQQSGRGGSRPRHGANVNQGSHPSFVPASPSPTAYINPAFVNPTQNRQPVHTHVDHNALPQVMSFMPRPIVVQSMPTSSTRMNSANSAAPIQPQNTPGQHIVATADKAPTLHAGHKRKLNESNKPQPPRPSTKPPRAKAAVAPPVPSFGFSLPPAPVVWPSNPVRSSSKHDAKKRKLNLGLTKEDVPDESSGEEQEEELDEEAAYAQKLKGGGFIFEHGGEQISIQTGAEVAAWIKDRRKNFPTQKRIIEKAEQVARKRHDELEFLRRIHGKPSRMPEEEKSKESSKPPNKPQSTRREDALRKQEELSALRKKLHEGMTKKQGGSKTVDLGLGYDSETDSNEGSSVLSESSVVSSSEESSDESESECESEVGQDEEAPEAASSKVGPMPITVPPPVPVKTQAGDSKSRVCSNWAQHGRCKFSNKCRFAHPAKVEQRMSLYDRMMEQELVKADGLALEAIKYLGQNGFLG